MTLNEVKNFIDRQTWVFAKTYAKFSPHEYIVKMNLPADEQETFIEVVKYIRANGFRLFFGNKAYTYIEVDDKMYWTMGDPIADTYILNRCNIADYTLRYRGGKR